LEFLLATIVLGGLALSIGATAFTYRSKKFSKEECSRLEHLLASSRRDAVETESYLKSKIVAMAEEIEKIQSSCISQGEEQRKRTQSIEEVFEERVKQVHDEVWSQLNDMRGHISSSGKAMESIEATVSSIQLELADFQHRVEAGIKVLLDHFKDGFASVKGQQQEDHRVIGILQEAVDLLRERINTLASSTKISEEGFANLSSAHESLLENLSLLANDLEHLKEEIRSRSDQEREKYTSLLGGLHGELAMLGARVEREELRVLSAQKEQEARIQEQVSRLFEELPALRERISSSIENTDQLKNTISSLQLEVGIPLAELQSQVDCIKGVDIPALRSDSQDRKGEVDQLEKRLSHLWRKMFLLLRIVKIHGQRSRSSMQLPPENPESTSPIATQTIPTIETTDPEDGSSLEEPRAPESRSDETIPSPEEDAKNGESESNLSDEEGADTEASEGLPGISRPENEEDWIGEGLDPRLRGGRRPGSSGDTCHDKRLCLEVRCQKKGGTWRFYLDVPRSLRRKHPDIKINGASLPIMPDWTCDLSKPFGEIVCSWTEYGKHFVVSRVLSENDYLLFKLEKRNGLRGRLVETYGEGNYLCVVPIGWTRADPRSGTGLSEREDVSVPGYKGLLFSPSPELHIALRTSGGKVVHPSNNFLEFFLEGAQSPFVRGLSGEPFFIGELPVIWAVNPESWSNVYRVVVRKETEATVRPKEFLTLEEMEREKGYSPENCVKGVPVRIPDWVNGRDGGRFSVLLYEKSGRLMQKGLYFAFHAAVSGIQIDHYDPFNEKDDRGELSVQVFHKAGYEPVPFDEETGNISDIEAGQTQTTMLVPILGNQEDTSWVLRKGCADEVAFSIRFPGFSWALGDENGPSQWRRTPIEVGFEEIDPLSDKTLFVKVPDGVTSTLASFLHVGAAKPQRLEVDDDGFLRGDLSKIGGQLYASQDRFRLQRIPLILRFKGKKKEHFGRREIGHFLSRVPCPFCDSCVPEAELMSHLQMEHGKEFVATWFEEPGEEHRQEALKSLPTLIFKCGACSFFVDATNREALDVPESVIANHVERESVIQKRKVGFMRIDDPDRIRETVLLRLSEARCCKICKEYLTDQETMFQHFFRKHKRKLSCSKKGAQ
jgi:hypothetical protein